MNEEVALAIGAGIVHGGAILLLMRVAFRFVELPPAGRERLLRLALLVPVIVALRAGLGAVPPIERLAEAESAARLRVAELDTESKPAAAWPAPEAGVPGEGPRVVTTRLNRTVQVEVGWPPAIALALSALGLVWLGGALLGVVRLFRSTLDLRRELAGAGPAPPGWEREVAEEAAALSTALPELRVAATPSPFAAPGRLLVLPPWFGELAADERRSILAHELAHLKRRDPERQLATEALRALLWPVPLVGWALDRIRDAVEHRCDDWAVRRAGDGRTLARALANVAGRVGAPGDPSPVGAFAASSGLATRVSRALHGPEERRRGAIPVLVALLVLSALAIPPLRPGGDLRVQVETHASAWVQGEGEARAGDLGKVVNRRILLLDRETAADR